MKFTFQTIVLSSVLIASSCSSETTKNEPEVKKNIEKIVTAEKVLSNKEMEVEVEGMMCMMGCGSSIRKALKETGGVESCSFKDFNDENEWNKAVIRFDSEKISADKIISIVEEINEKQFATRNPKTISIEQTDSQAKEGSKTSTTEEEKTVTMHTNGFELPNLLNIFRSMLNE